MTSPYKLIIFDADKTLRRCIVPKQPCPNKPGDWELFPDVKDRLAQFHWGDDVWAGVASNQAGVALGYLTETMAHLLLVDMCIEAFDLTEDRLEVFGFNPVTIQMCPHAPDAGCDCRKPQPGMLWRLMAWHSATSFQTLYVGDMESDRLAAEVAGCDFAWAWEFFGREKPE